ncbi:PAS domain S-box protein [Methylocapsa palsarum]|uniref:histidine kinase n=1 Tax=Methylocapsa palsarum TaxID=1612308 RepID=A0A1I4CVL7_9HYPH|nr:PAS domain S-box protein [Methylocapsa palsarum]SFK84843.1 PAS domain S-box-containing protein [Methylocapsa palsarum]
MFDARQSDLYCILFDNVDIGVALLDRNHCVVGWNAWLASATAISAEAAVGRQFEEFLPHASSKQIALAVAASLESGTSRLLTHSLHPALLPLKTDLGQEMIHDVTVCPVDGGGVRYCLVQVFDVTVAVKRERLLRDRQNARYDAVVDSAPDVILTVDDEGAIQFANPAADRQFGYPPKELVGRSAALLFEDRAAWNETLHAVIGGDVVRQPVEVIVRRKDGSSSYLEVSLSRWRSQSRVLITAILRDVNERRIAQEILRTSEAQFRALAQAMPNHVWTALPDGQLDWFNDRVYEYSGMKPGTLDGERWISLVHPEELSTVTELWRAALKSGTPYEAQFRIRSVAGIYRWHLSRAFPMRGPHDVIIRWVGSNTDVEDQKIAARALADVNATLEQRVSERTRQLMEAEEALRQSQKMEAVGQLTGGIAHDFNNLLQGILGALDFIKRRIAEGRIGDIDRFLNGALDSANRAATLTHRLLAFSRRQPVDPRPVEINRLVGTVEELLRRSLGENVNLSVTAGEEVWLVRCDSNQLENALLNLAINARDAMPDGGTMTIDTANKVLDANEARQRDLSAGEYVCLRVIDTGVGMTPSVKARAFDPFYTTKPIGKGTGLGLSMIYGFVRQSEGSVTIDSEFGKGTSVEICLPRYKGNVDDALVDESLGDNRAGAHEVVLIVEDQAVVRLLMVEALNDLGYQVLETAGSEAALRILQSSQRVDLLVSDIGLPGLNGRQLADAARVKRPDLKVLLVTGYAENATGRSFLEPGMEIVIKPFTIDALVSKIRDMILSGRGKKSL